jgi:hypothetical protein
MAICPEKVPHPFIPLANMSELTYTRDYEPKR